MTTWRSFCAACCLLILSEATHAALSQQARQEIDGLLKFVESSGCSFIRNGESHSPVDARAHLQKKFDYLADKDKLASAEDFIEHAATESSISGEPYSVDCAGQKQLSGEWLRQELQRLRKP
ncbi:MAG: DUF5329 domain-containing protein [Pseudomonas sp.]|uniref:DUF5329 family protein n=1 Tax=Pseudomonas sp. TaxID=306 RepID=UPI00339674BD